MMTNRDYVKNLIDTLPESVVDKIMELISTYGFMENLDAGIQKGYDDLLSGRTIPAEQVHAEMKR